MPTLAGLLGYVDSVVTPAKRKLADLLANPVDSWQQMQGGLLDDTRRLDALYKTAGDGRRLDAQGSVMGGLPQYKQAQQQQLSGLLNVMPVGTFVGPKAKTWDAVAAQKAQQLEAAGVDPRKIWSETGTFKGPDGMWRQEIPDNAAAPLMTTGKMANESANSRLYMGRTYKHPELYDTYPELKTLGVKVEKGNGAAFYPNSYEVKYGTQNPKGLDIVKPDVTAHELQHAIQGIEGWAKGGSSKEIGDVMGEHHQLQNKFEQVFNQFLTTKDEIAKKNASQQMDYYLKRMEPLRDFARLTSPEEGYARLAGEAEARATQARMPLNAAQRRALFPLDSYDVPLDQLIIRK